MFVYEFPVLSETFILRQITGLVDDGHDVEIFAGGPDSSATKIHPDVNRYRLMERTRYAPWVAEDYHLMDHATLSERIPAQDRGLHYDVIHCHFGPMGVAGVWLRKEGVIDGPIVTSFHGFDLTAFPKGQDGPVYEQLFRSGEMFTANSSFSKERMVELGCPRETIVRLPVGLDPSFYHFRERKLNSGEPIRLLTVARLVEKKGLDFALRAVAMVAQVYPHVQYRIVGDGPLRDRLTILAHELGINDKVSLLGWKSEEELRGLYAEASIFLLPSVTTEEGDHEGLGLVLQEAQAVGLPVVSTLHDGIPEAVVDGESAFLVPERDIDTLGKMLTYLIEHPDLWPEMGRRGRRHVEENFDIHKLNDRLLDVYRRVM